MATERVGLTTRFSDGRSAPVVRPARGAEPSDPPVPPLAPDDCQLEALARRLAAGTGDRPDLAARATRLAERIAGQRFHVAVLGEFKRGKSTLVNALVGQPLLPTGAVPLTAVATEVHLGSTLTEVVYLDGRRTAIANDDLFTYVTESGNPGNERQVARVEVGVDSSFGVEGLVLVDTPGIASVNEHNTETARDALLDSDAAVLVLSADSPLSESERELLEELRERRSRVFIVINKADHVTESELDQVRRFVAGHLERIAGGPAELYCVTARAAWDSGGSGRSSSFEAFRSSLQRFVDVELAGARRAAASQELLRLARGLVEWLDLEDAAAAMDARRLARQLQRFESAAADGARLLAEDGIVLEHETSSAVRRLGDSLTERAAAAADRSLPGVKAALADVPARKVADALRAAVEDCVRTCFEPLRREAERAVEQEWVGAATRYETRVSERVNSLVEAANELFDVHLPAVSLPDIDDQRHRFSYLFLHVEGPNAVVERSLQMLLPPRLVKRQALRRARESLCQELDKHAGRARHDIDERVADARRQLVVAMRAEFDQTQQSVVSAAASVRSRAAMTSAQRAAHHEERASTRTLVDEITRAVAPDDATER